MSLNEQELSQQSVKVDLSQADDVECSMCKNRTFEQVFLIKKISALLSPTGKEAYGPIAVFACNACGNVNSEFLPVAIRENAFKKQSNIVSSPLEIGK